MDLKPTWRTPGARGAIDCHGKQSVALRRFSNQCQESGLDLAPSLNMVDLLNVKLSYERAV
jgi:hypothetical protein